MNNNIISNSNSPLNQSSQRVMSDDHRSIGWILVSTYDCVNLYNNRTFYCSYVAFVIFTGYVLSLSVMPLTLSRMHVLKSKFRNQYNLSFNWLCALLLVATLDLMEYVVSKDARVYSVLIVFSLVCYFFVCLLTMISHYNVSAVHGNRQSSLISVCVCGIVFISITILRLLSKNVEEGYTHLQTQTNNRYNLAKLLPYYAVYAYAGGVQFMNNLKHRCARCFSNLGYAAWILGAFCLSFYSLLLPVNHTYDRVKYRNYFLLTSILAIMLQDAYFFLVKLKEKENRQYLNSISSNSGGVGAKTTSSGNYRGLKQMDNLFETKGGQTSRSSSLLNANLELVMDTPISRAAALPGGENEQEDDDKEDVVYQASQFDKRGAKTSEVKPNLFRTPSEDSAVYNNDLSIRIRVVERRGFVERLVDRVNKKLLVASFIMLLLTGIFFATILLLKSTVLSIYSLLTVFFYPALFGAHLALERYLRV